jgi:hypothetical protein
MHIYNGMQKHVNFWNYNEKNWLVSHTILLSHSYVYSLLNSKYESKHFKCEPDVIIQSVRKYSSGLFV